MALGLESLNQNVEIARKLGVPVSVSNIYFHNKVVYNEEGSLDVVNFAAIRVTEPWAVSDLYDFAKALILRNQRMYRLDLDYKMTRRTLDKQEKIIAKAAIILRLIGDILQDLKKLHLELNVVHNDTKLANMLLFIKDGRLSARITDFHLSKTAVQIEANNCQPVATCTYASSQVVGFVVTTDKKLTYSDLFLDFTTKRAGMADEYRYASYGRELLYENCGPELKRQDFNDLKCDYKDDMFSLGVSLFMLITGHYPTNKNLSVVAVDNFNYLNVRLAYHKFPQYKELLEGLLEFEREKRFSIEQAINAYNRITPLRHTAPPAAPYPKYAPV